MITNAALVSDTTSTAQSGGRPEDPSKPLVPVRRRRILETAALCVLMGLGVAIWGGYAKGWAWTGVTDKDTLWHWMQILMVPIAFACLPVVLRKHGAMRRSRKILMLAVLAAFVVFVIVGYTVPLAWTGFPGNSLWDWMSMLLLPIAITSVRFLRTERKISAYHLVAGALILIGFAVLVAFGYMAPWKWTGFTGNTLLDWLQLLLLPILFPTVVVPAAANWLTAEKHVGKVN